MRDRQSSSVKLFTSSLKMASVTSTNVNELLPGLEAFLRSMVHSKQLDTDHRQIAAMYINKLDQLSSSKSSNEQQQSINHCQDDQSSINGEIISGEESDDFTDEEEEQRKKELLEQQQQQSYESTPTTERRSSSTDNDLYHSTRRKSNANHTQWYIDVPKNAYLEPSIPALSNGNDEVSVSTTASRMSISTASSSIIADGVLLTYDENHNWIGRYYVLDDFDLICFPVDKKILSENDPTEPLWVSDMTNAKVHTAVVDKIECLCLQIGLAEAIYVRPPDSSQMHIWLKAFRDAALSQKSKESISKGRSNVKTLSRNARRMFSQFNRKKGQIVSHLLDQMATVTRIDEKTRKHCELRGFLVVSLDNVTFVTKYCTIVDGLFRVHKSRLSEQTDHELCLARCTLSFPEERTRDIQFALIDDQIGTIFIRGNNIYSMGRLLNTLAKYVEITGSSSFVFTSGGSGMSTPLSKQRSISMGSSQPHIYSDVDSSSSINGKSNEIYSPASVKSLPSPPPPPHTKTPVYRNAAKLRDDDDEITRPFALPMRRHTNDTAVILNERDQNATPTVDTYDQPKLHDHVAQLVDRNNNHVITPPQRYDRQQKRTKNEEEHKTKSEHRSTSNGSSSHRSKPKAPIPVPPSDTSSSISSSPENTVFCLRSSDSSSQHRNSRRRHHHPHPPPRRSLTQTTPTDYVNKLANLFTKSFTSPVPSTSPDRVLSSERDISTQTYETLPTSIDKFNRNSNFRSPPPPHHPSDEQISLRRVYDIPITIERPTKFIITPFEQYQKPPIRNARSVGPISAVRFNHDNNEEEEEEEETPYSQRYDNLTAGDGVGKFRFVIPFNHSPASAFTTPMTSKSASPPSSSSSSTISSFSTMRQTTSSSSSNPNTNNNNSNARASLMTAV